MPIPRFCARRRRVRASAEAGFTLVELAATMLCITILGAVAMPRLQGYVLDSRLNAAKPYLMEIAAKQRMYFTETGTYCCTDYAAAYSEDVLTNDLGLNVAEIGDFCFMFVCPTTLTACTGTNPVAANFIVAASATDAVPQFEVWAVLRSAGSVSAGIDTTAVTSANGSCKPGVAKVATTGWVNVSTSGLAGRAGQAVVLRYPPPTNGLSTSLGNFGTHAKSAAIAYNWRDGVTLSDAARP